MSQQVYQPCWDDNPLEFKKDGHEETVDAEWSKSPTLVSTLLQLSLTVRRRTRFWYLFHGVAFLLFSGMAYMLKHSHRLFCMNLGILWRECFPNNMFVCQMPRPPSIGTTSNSTTRQVQYPRVLLINYCHPCHSRVPFRTRDPTPSSCSVQNTHNRLSPVSKCWHT